MSVPILCRFSGPASARRGPYPVRQRPVGLWIQNIGVRAGKLPLSLSALAAEDHFGLPGPFKAGWTWISLDDERWGVRDSGDLDATAAAEAGAPALAFSVHDSDSAYLVGADPGGVRFRLVVNEEALETDGELPNPEGSAHDAAVWASEHAPASPSAEELLRLGIQLWAVAPGTAPRDFGLRGPHLEEARLHLAQPAVALTVGDWRDVSEEVPRTLAETAAWVTLQPR